MDNASRENGILLIFCACIFEAFFDHIFLAGTWIQLDLDTWVQNTAKYIVVQSGVIHRAQIILTQSLLCIVIRALNELSKPTQRSEGTGDLVSIDS